MAIYDLYSKRQKRSRGEITDVYIYDEIPEKFRVQFIQIVSRTIGECSTHLQMESHFYQPDLVDQLYQQICEILRTEYGVFKLNRNANSYKAELFDFFKNTKNSDECLDIIELLSRCIINLVEKNPSEFRYNADETISEINTRFKENGIGYQFENTEIIRVDSQFIHSEVVKPVLHLFNSIDYYEGALDEFLSAHEHYRHENFKECLNDCLKAFESLMKAIHDRNGWNYNKTDTASKLINSCLEKNLIPSYLQSQFTSLRTMLETGVPTIRNKNSGHGQGSEIIEVPKELVSYMLHITASNLLYLAQCDKELQRMN
ncbi:hypothetical protein I5496_01980 [Citrobacter freundii]|uniref:STM4504/CBY_0614 family protein n=1 Tax=Citrobacter freundii TaxID=546 RepID=UPI0019086345|nr:hypothetical protein [Citrobacter freundii]MBJ9306974.1 hypothetical protein [Citrobacter freundii]